MKAFKNLKTIAGNLTKVFLVGAFVSCATKKVEIDGDAPRIFEKPGSNTGNLPGSGPSDPQELYIKKKSLSVVPLEMANTTGSLFHVDEERNYLFAGRGALTLGRYIDVNVNSNKSAKKTPDEKTADKATKDDKKENPDDELIKSMPNLEPSSPDARPIQRFKMKILSRYPNGDVLATAQRHSEAAQNQSDLVLQARIPYERLISGGPITTDDLTEIALNENSNGQLVERRSANWEDEYTLRMSGFNEANSKVAERLEQQREQLKKIRDQLKTRVVALAKEREHMAAERTKLMEKDTTSQATIDSLNKALLEKDSQIKVQQDNIATKEKEIAGAKPAGEAPK